MFKYMLERNLTMTKDPESSEDVLIITHKDNRSPETAHKAPPTDKSDRHNIQYANGPIGASKSAYDLSTIATHTTSSGVTPAPTNNPIEGRFSDDHQGQRISMAEPGTPPSYVRRFKRKRFAWRLGKRNRSAVERFIGFEDIEPDPCALRMFVDPTSKLAYWWSCVVSVAFLYNFWVILYRFEFQEIRPGTRAMWFTLDYTADAVYFFDIVVHLRTGFLEEGILQTDSAKLRAHYMRSAEFLVDCLCLLPLDFLYLVTGFNSLFRLGRILKIYRFWAMTDHTERHTNFPNVVRTASLLHGLFSIFHWNACFISMVHRHLLLDDDWNSPDNRSSLTSDLDLRSSYLRALYKSTLILTMTGNQLPKPETKSGYTFVFAEIVFALFLFAIILGLVANIVTSVSAARKDFQAKLDNVKTYMSLRRVPLRLQDRIIRWFDYLWISGKTTDETRALALLPDKLRAEIALHVHLDTLKRVDIFRNTEAGFLCELVLRLRPVLFSPDDYVCRKGEIGKEMYIVSRGRLEVVADDGKTVLAVLRPGSHFGEISILNVSNSGNRRTASVRSVGYSDLFCLSKNDMWEVLKDYPLARARLEAIAVKRLQNYSRNATNTASFRSTKDEGCKRWVLGQTGNQPSMCDESAPNQTEERPKVSEMSSRPEHPAQNIVSKLDQGSIGSLSPTDEQLFIEKESGPMSKDWFDVRSHRLCRSEPTSPPLDRLTEIPNEYPVMRSEILCSQSPDVIERSQSASSLMTCVTEISIYRSPNSSLTPPGSTRSSTPVNGYDNDDNTPVHGPGKYTMGRNSDAHSTKYFDRSILQNTGQKEGQIREFPLLSTSLGREQCHGFGFFPAQANQSRRPTNFITRASAGEGGKNCGEIAENRISWINVPHPEYGFESRSFYGTDLIQSGVSGSRTSESGGFTEDFAAFQDIGYLRAKIRELCLCNETLRDELRRQRSESDWKAFRSRTENEWNNNRDNNSTN